MVDPLNHSAAPSRKLPRVSLSPYVQADYETNRWYQAGLLQAPDTWLWDFVTGGTSKSFPLTVTGLDAMAGGQAQLHVVFQGASDAAEVAESCRNFILETKQSDSD